MSSRAIKRAKRALKERQAEFDALRNAQGKKRPGSMNPKKSHGGRRGKRR